ncbi:hypothetical protein ACIQBJ_04320 [Kitasatospora sp. NPDC088391]|uniref:hypothetical protein n=1 Tax=Kitasatospora sp. NPDC088391 TaxID=3364074 RepID=UPI003828F453
MKSPDMLDGVDWGALTHAYGSADDLPELIRGLYGEEPAAVEEARHELVGAICHQGSVHPASAAAVPFLVHAARHAPLRRDHLLVLLFLMAEHDPELLASRHWAASDTAAVCRELCLALPELLPCLDDPAAEVRQAALRVVAAVADLLPEPRRAELAVRATDLHGTDPAAEVRADALVLLDRLGRPLSAPDHPLAPVRAVSALLAAERHGPPYPAGAVAALAAEGPDAAPEMLWPVTGSTEQHRTDLLTQDPDAALTVAARWIADGDRGTRGSWLAEAVVETWRDREADVLGLLHAALPHHAEDPSVRLRVLAHWIDHLPAPDARLRDTLFGHAAAGADTALLGLVRARAPRALALLADRPGPELLAEAARLLPAEAVRPLVLRQLADRTDPFRTGMLLEALDPADGAALPVLTACLREGRAAVEAARALGRTGRATPEAVDLLRRATPEAVDLLRRATADPDQALRAAAAAAHHRLTGDTALALPVFAELLGLRHPAFQLRELARLGPAAAPLLPLVEPLLAARDHVRLAAATAHHRLTGDAAAALPVLTGLLRPDGLGLDALRALTAVGRLPDGARPAVRALAFSPHRLVPDHPLSPTGGGHADREARTLALALLRT